MVSLMPEESPSTAPEEGTQDTVTAPTITQIFTDVALYKQVIDDPERAPLVLDNKSIKGFAELLGHDLDTPEKTLASRFAQLSAEDLNWAEPRPSSPDTYSDEEGESAEGEQTVTSASELPASSSFSGSAESDGFPRAQLTGDVPPEEIVRLVRSDFGDLAPDGEERLLIGTDSALVHDVIVLGVIHVTTHRFAFHASLPSNQADSYSSRSALRVGSAVLHRTGFHRKRRIWLELSHDFLCLFPSASEDDRIRPLSSFLLSSIKEVRPEDPDHPRLLRIILANRVSQPELVLGFDTVEATRGWRRDLQGTIFLYRRTLYSSLQPSDAEDTDSVKISIPLPCIKSVTRSILADTIRLTTLEVFTDRSSSSLLTGEDESNIQTVQFATAPRDTSLDRLDSIVEESRRGVSADDLASLSLKVIVDCASISLEELRSTEESIGSETGSKAKTVCDALGIPYSSDVWITQARLHLGPISTGYLVISHRWVGFWCKSLALSDEKYRIRTSAIQAISPIDPWLRNIPKYGLQLDIHGHPSLKLHFRSEVKRNETLQRLREAMDKMNGELTSSPLGSASSLTPPSTPPPLSRRPSARSSAILAPISRTVNHPARQQIRLNSDVILRLPKAVNLPPDVVLTLPPMHFVCLTIGSRGDVQPYIAFGVRLLKQGHKVTIVTHEEYKDWVEDFGIGHRTAGGDPGQLMRLSVENKMFSPQFFKESISNFRTWLDQLLMDAWRQCGDAQILLESPYAFAGVHIAEALCTGFRDSCSPLHPNRPTAIPFFRVCTMPWTKTAEFPHPFISPPVETPRSNRISYILFDNVLWAATSTQVNRWRREVLHLDSIDMSHSAQAKIPIIYNFSPSVVPKPLDWSDTAYPSGYWFLDNPDGPSWAPPASLTAWMSKARQDEKLIVYIGFGSITVPNPNEVTERIIQAVLKSGVRAIISKGWSARMSKEPETAVDTPEECYMIDKIPHDWLFPKVDAALHHGGAGTTSASLRAGIPTLIKPWFGDQYFWASRVQRLGAGLRIPSLRVNDVADALVKATTDRIMKEKAAIAGEKIRSEDGVDNAIQFIATYLPRAIRTAQHI
ncbi:UDP-Glycosyltransferase/glycogen phosphorylase, partial [Panus rudis PR-1116 ss-1]